MEFRTFDEEYLRRLRAGDPETESHFAAYFGELIHLKLRGHVWQRQLLEDIRQETLCRVLKAVREKQDGVADPRKFGAFVSGVCHFVTIELSRNEGRFQPSENEAEPRDTSQDLDAPLIDEDRKRQVRKILGQLEVRDRQLLRALFLEEMEPVEVCRRFEVGPDYLRVLVFRAKARFRKAYARSAGAS
ncbi:MAG TPA: sigma-70 family RNA polymerase sigma factor [Bryobacteraceae bacterium]|nr:sigma-70 family RNA polymerase sigma factor [Bryobacteraceae bacterium]